MRKLTLTSVIVMLIIPFVLIGAFWTQIPDTIPIHFNGSGEADRFGPKVPFIFLMPVISVFTFLLIYFIPYIDPKKRIANSQTGISAFIMIMVVFFLGLFLLMLSQILGHNIFGNYIVVAIPLFLLMLGNYMSKVKPNYFIGVRTPWTLQSEVVWDKTHRFTGRLWVIISLVMLVIGISFNSSYPGWATAIYIPILAIAPIVYSYVVFKNLPEAGIEG